MTFEELHLDETLVRAVASEGYTTPTPIQLQAIPHVLAGADLMGTAQTGTGKTAAFALPLLQHLSRAPFQGTGKRPIRCLVLAPTRELAAQIWESFRSYGRHCNLRSVVIFGGVNQKPQVSSLINGVDIAIATPGRLLDLMNQGFVDLRQLQHLVLDEADNMLDMGFIHDIRKIIARIPAKRQTLMFSATMPPEIRELAHQILHQPVKVQVAAVATPAETVDQSVYFVDKAQKPAMLAHYLNNNGIERVLVFTRTKHGADRVAKQLIRLGIHSLAIHGNKSQNARVRAMASFKSSAPPVLVATDIAARGLDIDDISHVVNYEVPNVPETYVHRIGRTGRAEKSGTAVSFCEPDERPYLRDIEKLMQRKVPVRPTPTMPPLPPVQRQHMPEQPRPTQHPPRYSAHPQAHGSQQRQQHQQPRRPDRQAGPHHYSEPRHGASHPTPVHPVGGQPRHASGQRHAAAHPHQVGAGVVHRRSQSGQPQHHRGGSQPQSAGHPIHGSSHKHQQHGSRPKHHGGSKRRFG
jgi:ATP-dependent RNA helicase RhlE